MTFLRVINWFSVHSDNEIRPQTSRTIQALFQMEYLISSLCSAPCLQLRLLHIILYVVLISDQEHALIYCYTTSPSGKALRALQSYICKKLIKKQARYLVCAQPSCLYESWHVRQWKSSGISLLTQPCLSYPLFKPLLVFLVPLPILPSLSPILLSHSLA